METKWQEQFDKLYEETKSFGYAENEYPSEENINNEEANHAEFKAFIQQLLDSQKREILEKITLEPRKRLRLDPETLEAFNNGYNQAVSDLEALKATLTPPIEGKDENPPEDEI